MRRPVVQLILIEPWHETMNPGREFGSVELVRN